MVGNGKKSIPEEFTLDLQEYEGVSVDGQLLPQLKSMIEAAGKEILPFRWSRAMCGKTLCRKNTTTRWPG